MTRLTKTERYKSAPRYKDDRLRLVWALVRNGTKLMDLPHKCNCDEDEAKALYRQAYEKFGLDGKNNMPRPYYVADLREPKGKGYVNKVKPPPELFGEKIVRPKAEYTNGGYISLLKKYCDNGE